MQIMCFSSGIFVLDYLHFLNQEDSRKCLRPFARAHFSSNFVLDCSATRANIESQFCIYFQKSYQRIWPKPVGQHHALAIGVVLVIVGSEIVRPLHTQSMILWPRVTPDKFGKFNSCMRVKRKKTLTCWLGRQCLGLQNRGPDPRTIPASAAFWNLCCPLSA